MSEINTKGQMSSYSTRHRAHFIFESLDDCWIDVQHRWTCLIVRAFDTSDDLLTIYHPFVLPPVSFQGLIAIHRNEHGILEDWFVVELKCAAWAYVIITFDVSFKYPRVQLRINAVSDFQIDVEGSTECVAMMVFVADLRLH